MTVKDRASSLQAEALRHAAQAAPAANKSMFPLHRPRRLRKNEVIRRMVRETSLSPDDLTYPLFVTFGRGVKKEISSMPGCFQESVDIVVKHAKEVYSLGIPAVLLFGIPEHKDELGSGAYDEHGVVQKAIRAIKNKVPELLSLPMFVCVNTRAMA